MRMPVFPCPRCGREPSACRCRHVLTARHLIEAASFTATMLAFFVAALWSVTR